MDSATTYFIILLPGCQGIREGVRRFRQGCQGTSSHVARPSSSITVRRSPPGSCAYAINPAAVCLYRSVTG
jgi:hypothetical protein